MKKFSLFAMVLVSSLVLSGCMHAKAPQVPQDTVMEDEAAVEDDDAMIEEGDEAMEGDEASTGGAMVDLTSEQSSEATVALTAEQFTFGTEEIRVKKGTTLTIAVTNAEGVHDFLIDELNVDSGMIPAGETVELTIPTDTAGEYEYYCSVGNHKAMGMKGMLIIEE